jgi:two-component system OmpR family sensor kinase
LLGIEAAAAGLTRHRERLTVDQLDSLSHGLLGEVERLRGLLDGRVLPPATFDLADAICPVVTCVRASGLDVRSNIPVGIDVSGSADRTAQVVLALLTNARRHAAGSPVDVHAEAVDDRVVLYVEDRGPGIPPGLSQRVFERRMKAVGSDGSGLGLFIARRLMEEQGGTIDIAARAGGGCSVVLRFHCPAPTVSPPVADRVLGPELATGVLA